VKLSAKDIFIYQEEEFLPDKPHQSSAHVFNQMWSFLVIRQVCANAFCHQPHERSIIHVEPVRPSDQPLIGIPNEWTVDIGA
jgi:hypothetical protein